MRVRKSSMGRRRKASSAQPVHRRKPQVKLQGAATKSGGRWRGCSRRPQDPVRSTTFRSSLSIPSNRQHLHPPAILLHLLPSLPAPLVYVVTVTLFLLHWPIDKVRREDTAPESNNHGLHFSCKMFTQNSPPSCAFARTRFKHCVKTTGDC